MLVLSCFVTFHSMRRYQTEFKLFHNFFKHTNWETLEAHWEV